MCRSQSQIPQGYSAPVQDLVSIPSLQSQPVPWPPWRKTITNFTPRQPTNSTTCSKVLSSNPKTPTLLPLMRPLASKPPRLPLALHHPAEQVNTLHCLSLEFYFTSFTSTKWLRLPKGYYPHLTKFYAPSTFHSSINISMFKPHAHLSSSKFQ